MNKYIYKYIFNILFLLVLIIIKGCCENANEKAYIIIPFKSYFPQLEYSFNENNALINLWIRRKLYLDIENSSGQKIPIILNTNEPKMYTRDVIAVIRTEDKYYEPYNQNVSDICSFNYSQSITYQLTSEFNYSFYTISNICYAKEKIYLYNDFNLKEKKLYDIEFIHSSNESNICMFGGLQIAESLEDKKINLFYQLKHLIKSNSYSWTLKFISPDEGFLIFGDIINNNQFNFYNDNHEENYISLYIPSLLTDKISWKLYFEKIYFDDYIIKPSSQIYFFINFQTRYITVPNEYFNNIKLKYLLTNDNNNNTYKEMEPICFDEEIEGSFYTVYCNKKEYLELTDNYKKLPELNLYGYRIGFNITFTPQELFLEKDDKIYFLIGYNHFKNNEWNIGTIFFEKYVIIFDNDSKQLRILKNNTKTKNEINNEFNNSFENKKFIIIIIVFFSSALVFGFLGIYFGKLFYQKRKKKANELDDEYDYSPQNINIEQDNENKLLDN